MHYPSVTIITATLNPDSSTFIRVLQAIKKQKYQGRIEHIILDGGTTNDALDIAKQYNCKILQFKNSRDEGGNRLYFGLEKAKGEIILILESDNIIPHSLWLRKMIKPFEEKKVFSTYPAYNSYTSDMSLLTKYTALFGAPEPTLYYLKKSDKLPRYQITYDKGTTLRKTKDFWIVKFTKKSLPTMGDNGFFVKKSVLQQFVKKNKTYIHVDVFTEMLTKGYDTYGVVKENIIHTTHANIFDLIKRRVAVKQNFYNERQGKRKYLVYDPNSLRDKMNLLKYIFFSITFVFPFFESLRGYLHIREKAWFLHPVMCFLMVISYSVSEIQWVFKKHFKLL